MKEQLKEWTQNEKVMQQMFSLQVDIACKTIWCPNIWVAQGYRKAERVYSGSFTTSKVNAYH